MSLWTLKDQYNFKGKLVKTPDASNFTISGGDQTIVRLSPDSTQGKKPVFAGINSLFPGKGTRICISALEILFLPWNHILSGG